jgi:hypothetical protein
MQSLFDEVALSQTGLLTEKSTDRTSALLNAETVVNGTLTSDSISIKIRACALPASLDTTGVKNTQVNGPLAGIMKLEKNLVFEMLGTMGITLTDDERKNIETPATENVLAFIAYSTGLDFEDNGDFAKALEHFQSAANQDPGFVRAREAAVRTERKLSAMELIRARKRPETPTQERPAMTVEVSAKNARPVFTIGQVRLSATGPASISALDAANSGFMPDRSVRRSGGAVSGNNAGNSIEARNAYPEAFGIGLSGATGTIPVSVPIPEQ